MKIPRLKTIVLLLVGAVSFIQTAVIVAKSFEQAQYQSQHVKCDLSCVKHRNQYVELKMDSSDQSR